MSRKQMQEKDRYTIEKMLKMKVPVAQIAQLLGRNRSTIYREIKKGRCTQLTKDWQFVDIYLSDVGQRKHDTLAKNKGSKKKLSADDTFLKDVSYWIIEQKYSPEAALYKIARKKLCAKSVYNYIHAGYIKGVTVELLPYAKSLKKKKSKVVKRPFARGRSIEDRSKEIKERKTKGHWEMDTVYSSKDDKTCLLVLTERKTREELIFRIKDRTCNSVIAALNRYERKIGSKAFREKIHTITCDNGMEFADWQGIEKSIRNITPRTITYFCHPYCSGERGSNENQNKMIRRWIPKGDDIGLYTPEEIAKIQDWLNNYPRKIFGGKSSNDMLT